MTLAKFLRLAGTIALPLIVGGISGFITSNNIPDWYAHLNKPFFNPPNYLFAPVWTILYILMGISFYMIYESEEGPEQTAAIRVYILQLFLNFWWSFIFFSRHRLSLALGEIILLWLSILWMIVVFSRIKPVAGYLQIPYLLWVTFALVLNATLWLLNY